MKYLPDPITEAGECLQMMRLTNAEVLTRENMNRMLADWHDLMGLTEALLPLAAIYTCCEFCQDGRRRCPVCIAQDRVQEFAARRREIRKHEDERQRYYRDRGIEPPRFTMFDDTP